MRFIEWETAFNKGKGGKTRPIIQMKDDVTEAELSRATASKSEDAPILVLCVKNDAFDMACIKCDSVVLYTQADNALSGLLVLMAAYYVFDLKYPRCYSQLLGLLQQKVLGEPFTGEKSMKYKHFISQL